MTTTDEFDVLVIGGGPGGYTSAIRASQLGLNVALVERETLGGVCLNWGCIPTKSLLHTADVLRDIRSAGELGLEVGRPQLNLKKTVQRSRDVAKQLSTGIMQLIKKNNVKLYEGVASFVDKNIVSIGDRSVFADNVIIATGATARNLPHINDSNLIWDARVAMTPAFVPQHLLIVGAGAIGVEFASFYNTIGTEVTLIEIADQILPAEDTEIAERARQAFVSQGIDVRTETGVDVLEQHENRLIASIAGESTNFDAAIVSVGVSGNTHHLGLADLGVHLEGGFVPTDDQQQTNIAGVYAIGDVTGAPCLAHKASHEGIIAAESIAGLTPHKLNKSRIPGCTYSHPQIASIGLTEREAAECGPVRVGRFPLIANGKAVAINDTEGLIKTIFAESTGELLGAHMLGPGVTEMIQGFALAIGLETTEQELIGTIFPHPTLSEAMHESVLSAYARSINY